MKKQYLLLHNTLITALYESRNDLAVDMRMTLEANNNRPSAVRRYSIYELSETVKDSGVYLNPKKIEISDLLKEPA